MGCIEIARIAGCDLLPEGINSNMGCIEMYCLWAIEPENDKINSNMGCIEIRMKKHKLKRRKDKQ